MAFTVSTSYVIKNNKGEFYTGEWRSEGKWDANIKCATEYSSIHMIESMIQSLSSHISGFDYDQIESGKYFIETVLTVKETDED